jgi:hypothetical protein
MGCEYASVHCKEFWFGTDAIKTISTAERVCQKATNC